MKGRIYSMPSCGTTATSALIEARREYDRLAPDDPARNALLALIVRLESR
jgi:hypothetical protein